MQLVHCISTFFYKKRIEQCVYDERSSSSAVQGRLYESVQLKINNFKVGKVVVFRDSFSPCEREPVSSSGRHVGSVYISNWALAFEQIGPCKKYKFQFCPWTIGTSKSEMAAVLKC